MTEKYIDVGDILSVLFFAEAKEGKVVYEVAANVSQFKVPIQVIVTEDYHDARWAFEGWVNDMEAALNKAKAAEENAEEKTEETEGGDA